MIEPADEPVFDDKETSFGSKVIPSSNSVYPLGRPTEKYKSMELTAEPLVKEST